MRILYTFYFLFFAILCVDAQQQLTITEVGTLPEAVANNAVCEGFINETPYLFSFAGIDSTKNYAGIHLKSYRYNIQTGESETIPHLPDEMGKVACAASRIDSIIYISGGYHVFANTNEVSSNKMHRYNINTNSFMTDAADLPRATDDHVQAVWRDSLIYVITGWHDNTNIPQVQVYDPVSNLWSYGTSVPNNNQYKAFGASGVIIQDTIFYFGGASTATNFPAVNRLRKGVINPNNPTQIEWSVSTPDNSIKGYRMAATTVNDTLHWVGGSDITYNYDGIAYNNGQGVPTNNRDLYLLPGSDEMWQTSFHDNIPMDLRGIADISPTVKYIAGGMINPQEVTNKIYKLEWMPSVVNTNQPSTNNLPIKIWPMPLGEYVNILSPEAGQLTILDIHGRLIYQQNINPKELVVLPPLHNGTYFFHITTNSGKKYIRKVVK